jgi:ABC-type transport system involved in multi-copper enzyme maturation permease subunit
MSTPSDFGGWVTLVVLAVLLLLGVIVAIWLFAGLFQARSLFRRELSAYFLSPIAYVVLVVFLAMTGFLFYQTLDLLTAGGAKGVEYPMQKLLGDEKFWLVFLFIPPLLTMRLFAEERSTGTLEMLMTAPLRDWQVVLSKYFACFAFYVVLWLPTLAYLPMLLNLDRPQFQWVQTRYTLMLIAGLGAIIVATLLALPRFGTPARLFSVILLLAGAAVFSVGAYGHYHWEPGAPAPSLAASTVGLLGSPDGQGPLLAASALFPGRTEVTHLLVMPAGIDPWPVLSSYLGLALAGAMFLALGLLVSSLVRSQMVAALISLVLCLLFIGGGFWLADLDSGSAMGRVLNFFSVPRHFNHDFTRGVVDTRHLVLYGSVAMFCLFLTVRSLESRRWR